MTDAAALDDHGRCCGRKPMSYKRGHPPIPGPFLFCPRCDRAFDVNTHEQIPNWAWTKSGSEFVRRGYRHD